MKVTLSDLKTKLCHRTLVNDTFETCEGPRCMAWRWGRMPDNKVVIAQGHRQALREPKRPEYVPASYVWIPHDPVEDGPAMWLEPDEEAEARRTGFCGLAGVPDYD